MKKRLPPQAKRDHTVIVPNFFDEGENLEAWQLGWMLDSMREAKSPISKDIFNFYICELKRNIIFYYTGDGNFYGLHTEEYPTPFFTFRKDTNEPVIFHQIEGDTHDYEEDLVLIRFEDRNNIWESVKIDGKSLEEVLKNSYILTN